MPPVRKCCARCFGDRGLEKNIFPTLSIEWGTCSFCGTADVLLVLPSQLTDVFGLLANIYEESMDGRFLVELLREDWGMFHPSFDDPRAKELLAEVLDDGDIVRRNFRLAAKYKSDGLERWERLRAELMHENRYFPDSELDLVRLKVLLTHLIADEVDERWYRARLHTGDAAFEIGEMGAPPRRNASHGRANPAGIPYLYLGSTAKTAVAEIRPHTGDKACVAEFSVPRGLKLADLRNPRQRISPFTLTDEDEIGFLRSDIEFLEGLGAELTRPVVPQGAPVDYVPSQYLCEFIKKCGYAGVLYRSSVSDGFNLALFDPSGALALSVAEYDVVKVDADIRPA